MGFFPGTATYLYKMHIEDTPFKGLIFRDSLVNSYMWQLRKNLFLLNHPYFYSDK